MSKVGKRLSPRVTQLVIVDRSMVRALSEIKADLDGLQRRDFDMTRDDYDGPERLNELLPELVAATSKHDSIATILALIERLSSCDELDHSIELGTPGPLMHELERLKGYEPQLLASVSTFPTPLTVWAVNRIMNALTPESLRWSELLSVLEACAISPKSAPGAKDDAREFIEHQMGRARRR